ncbi:20-hydroxy-prefusarin hydrolase FUS2 [Lachnellula suecica]|uniref:20-hydroxy-prefusarin hydrolase FUS2 n=1 Tax=Lachnellula suecica TaxID=602035 RepID=A0A8T9BW22_9HELO|nr:20-hydroxy-prefusarin hydrolase FUS2 [Lachnellula suecica]
MLQLSEDSSFHFEAIRSLGITRANGSDIGETLAILDKIKPKDFEDWYREWHNLALRVQSSIDGSKSYSPVTLRDVYFRASHYFYVADFYTHGSPEDPRGKESYELWRKYFDMANAHLPIPGQHVTLDSGHGFKIPVILWRAPQASATNPRPTLILGGGFDSCMEELYNTFGIPALERGYNVTIYEGPGQPTLLREQGVGFIHDWEKAVTPIVDYILAHKSDNLAFMDTTKVGLLGWSLGGYFAARAAAFEPRLAAVICIDGVWDFGETFLQSFDGTGEALEKRDIEAFNRCYETIPTSTSSQRRWIRDHMKYSFQQSSGHGIYQIVKKMTLEGIADKIKMPAFVAEAVADQFFAGQPACVVAEIGANATLFKFDETHAAETHVHAGALTYLNQEIMEWYAGIVGDKHE